MLLIFFVGLDSVWKVVQQMKDPITVNYGKIEELFSQAELKTRKKSEEKKQPTEVYSVMM